MWLHKVWNRKASIPVKNICLQNSVSRCHNYLVKNTAYYYCQGSNILQEEKFLKATLLRGFQRHHSLIHGVNAFTRKFHNGIYRYQGTLYSPCFKGNLSHITNFSNSHIGKIPSLSIHSSACRRDIPDYLKGNISEVESAEDDLLNEIFEDEVENDMEEEILEFLNSHLLLYEETESSFMLPCLLCSADDQATRSQEIIIDKNSGYFVCPWCCQAGPWEELRHILDKREDTITVRQLSTYLEASSPISEVDCDILQRSPFQAVSVATLEKFGARLTSDGTRVIFPLKTDFDKVVGFESVSLLHHVPQIVRRFIAGEVKPLFSVNTHKNSQRLVVVPTCCDVLTLAEYKISAVSLPYSDISSLCDLLATCKEVILWLGIGSPPRQLLHYLVCSSIPSWIVRCEGNDLPVHVKSQKEVHAALKNVIPVQSEETTTFSELKDKIYYRLTNKEETSGVQWKRFSELNSLLLGHRLGEMTVLTGSTGSGKTTLMAEYSLDLCSQGVVTLWGSFEVSVVRLCEIMLQQYSGMPLPVDLVEFNALASKFSNLPLHFLTYHGQQTTKSVLKAMEESVRVWGVQHVIIDNLQFMLGTSERPIDRWWEQDKAVAAFRRFATVNNCHVTLIVHPKKVPEGQLLSIDSIFGGAKVTQEADNILILQVKESNTVNQGKKALQVVKNRYGGNLGVLPLRFHRESLTLSSHFAPKGRSNDKPTQNKRKAESAKRVKGINAFMQ
ncbi:mitochondrial DNA helicase [Palaemon carinicauda]|uniref:mitochondrial DNA helicase n=1 Tax=Palaemon carinicauda TaxID=392227 RepID=UPI0035B61579